MIKLKKLIQEHKFEIKSVNENRDLNIVIKQLDRILSHLQKAHEQSRRMGKLPDEDLDDYKDWKYSLEETMTKLEELLFTLSNK